jgi:hypothetical protein
MVDAVEKVAVKKAFDSIGQKRPKGDRPRSARSTPNCGHRFAAPVLPGLNAVLRVDCFPAHAAFPI